MARRYGRKALQQMYQVFLRRALPNDTATPAWMAEALVGVPPEEFPRRRKDLFEASAYSRTHSRSQTAWEINSPLLKATPDRATLDLT